MSVNLTAAPTLPDINDPATFNARALALLSWMTGTLVTEINGMDAADFFSVQSSPTDTTSGRVMKVGAFGLGAEAIDIDSGTDLNDITDSGLYSWNSSSVPANAPGSFFSNMLHIQRDANFATQLVMRIGTDALSGKIYTRSRNASGWNQWNQPYDTQNILGMVSQAAGVPTGAVIERGSNANGEYVRFADGTQICWRGPVNIGAVTTASGAIYESNEVFVSFAAVFSTSYERAASAHTWNTRINALTNGVGAGGTNVRLTCPVSQPASQSAFVMCIGRWF